MVQIPARINVGAEFDEGRRFLEWILAGITAHHQRLETALQHLRHQFEHTRRRSGAIEILFLVEVDTGERPLIGEILQRPIGDVLFVRPE